VAPTEPSAAARSAGAVPGLNRTINLPGANLALIGLCPLAPAAGDMTGTARQNPAAMQIVARAMRLM
jgi:hypothetical protein